MGATANHDQWWDHDTGLISNSVRASTTTASVVRDPSTNHRDSTTPQARVARDSTSHTAVPRGPPWNGARGTIPFHDWLLTTPRGPVRLASKASCSQYRVESDGRMAHDR